MPVDCYIVAPFGAVSGGVVVVVVAVSPVDIECCRAILKCTVN